jgi:hypothetical protein
MLSLTRMFGNGLTKMRSAALRPHTTNFCSLTAGRNVSSNAG